MRLAIVTVVAALVISSAGAEDSPAWFGQRLFDAFAKDLQSPAYQTPAPNSPPVKRRIPSAPFDSPPFPAADWQIGGTPIIGDPGNVGPRPLMEAIYAGPGGDTWKKSRIQIYGWEAFSWNVSTSTNTSRVPNAFLTLRNEFYDDIVGSRTGRATKYSEHSFGLTWWPDKIVTLRPELRFDLTTHPRSITALGETSSSRQWISSSTTDDPHKR